MKIIEFILLMQENGVPINYNTGCNCLRDALDEEIHSIDVWTDKFFEGRNSHDRK